MKFSWVFLVVVSLGIMGCEADSGTELPYTIPAKSNPASTVEATEEIPEQTEEAANTEKAPEYSISLFCDETGYFIIEDSESRTIADIQVYSTRRRNIYYGVASSPCNVNARGFKIPSFSFSFSDVASLASGIYHVYKLTNPETVFFEEVFKWVAGDIIWDLGKSAYKDMMDSSQATNRRDNVARRRRLLNGRRWDTRPW